ncbi:calpain-5 [Lates japonicus]|uniref:Calpain-5 n=1 Tax=Lates japonicus TaxID=270547 RepID=A0AAD3QVG9_LATJO|nr:calpain-5 [Lates japonicus]
MGAQLMFAKGLFSAGSPGEEAEEESASGPPLSSRLLRGRRRRGERSSASGPGREREREARNPSSPPWRVRAGPAGPPEEDPRGNHVATGEASVQVTVP